MAHYDKSRMPSIRQIELTAERVAAEFALTEEYLRDFKATAYLDPNVRMLVVRLHRLVYQREGRELRIPASWWDSIKHGIRACPRAPQWLKDRLVVAYDVHRAKQVFPELVPSRMGPTVEFFVNDGFHFD